MALLSPLLFGLASQRSNRARSACLGLQGVCLAAIAFMAWSLDGWAGLSASWLFCIGIGGAGFALSAGLALHNRSWSNFCLGLVFVSSMVAMHYFDLTPLKPYQRFYASIRNGMTEEEVLGILHISFPEGGHFRMPTIAVSQPDRVSLILNPADGRYNAELIVLSLRDRKLAHKAFFPD